MREQKVKSKPNSISREKMTHHAQILSNRVKKRFKHLSKRFKKQHIECFRLYDWDIPEVRAVVDWVGGHVVVGEYIRWQTGKEWLPVMAQAVGEALELPKSHIHTKKRKTSSESAPRYRRMKSQNIRLSVNERDLKFWVNLDDFLDIGLFSDHRDTRQHFKKLSKGKNVLNLFSYTGAFTCAAALGGAKSTVSVDRSKTYLQWAKENLQLNGLMGPQHRLIQKDAFSFLKMCQSQGVRFDLAFIDPPSFFQVRQTEKSFDINKDHCVLIGEVLKVMEPKSVVLFSTNHQRFTPQLERLSLRGLEELTPKTIPEDFRNRQIHRCWQIAV